VLAAVEIRPAKRLEDRLAARFEPVCAFEDDRGLRVVPAPEQLLTALEQVVSTLAFVGGVRLHRPMVARTGRSCRA
jgi:hypothetical protein